MILFGWNNYSLKTLRPEELGLTSTELQDISIQYRQKYFHLFFIPCFPLGKFWAVRKNGKLYEPASELHAALNDVPVKTKAWIWAWSGVLLVIAAWAFYNLSEKMERASYQKRTAAHQAMLTDYFKKPENTRPLFRQWQTLNFLADSAMQETSFKQKKIDTTEENLMRLYLDAALTQTDSLTGYTPQNTFVVKQFRGNGNQVSIISDDIKQSLQDGRWTSGYSDTGSVFSTLRTLGDYKYLLVVKEYNRADPQMQTEGYVSGFSLANAAIINLSTKKVEKEFKIIEGNSEKVNHYTYRRKGEPDNMSSAEWQRVLNTDLEQNVSHKVEEYVFGERDNIYP